MATALDIVNRAARRVGVLADNEAFQGFEITNALQGLNDMMFAFPPMGIQYVHTTLLQGDTVNVPDEQVRNLWTLFCKDMADDFSVPISPSLALDIDRALKELQAAYLVIDPAQTDRALRRRRPGFFNFSNS